MSERIALYGNFSRRQVVCVKTLGEPDEEKAKLQRQRFIVPTGVTAQVTVRSKDDSFGDPIEVIRVENRRGSDGKGPSAVVNIGEDEAVINAGREAYTPSGVKLSLR